MKQLTFKLLFLFTLTSFVALSQTTSTSSTRPWRVDGRLGYSFIGYDKSEPKFNSLARGLNLGLQFRVERFVLALDMNAGEHTYVFNNSSSISGEMQMASYSLGLGYALQSKHIELVPKLMYFLGTNDLLYVEDNEIDDLNISGAALAVELNFTPTRGYGFFLNFVQEIDPILENVVGDSWDNTFRQLSVGIRMDLFTSHSGE
ncbi:MAG: hypothetical protein HWE14_01390 [Flavobacteriia bacterium]|nr:hypothetical protein [Flavobacteriia bacterium]